jgi:hypothetical protein
MDKILVHATSLDNLSNILLSGFLAHPSLAILNNEQKQSSTTSTPLDHLSFNFGNVVFVANPNNVLNKHDVNVYPCDSASATLPILKPHYVSSIEALDSDSKDVDLVDELHGWFKSKFPNKQHAVDFYFHNYQQNYNPNLNVNENKSLILKPLLHVQMENLYFILKNYDLIEHFNNQSKLSDIQEIFYPYHKQTQFKHLLDHKMQTWMIEALMSNSKNFNNKFAFQADHTLKNYVHKINELSISTSNSPNNPTNRNYISFNQTEMEMFEKMHQDGLMKFYLSLSKKRTNNDDDMKPQSKYIEFTKQNINEHFKKHDGLEKLTESDLNRLDDFYEWEEYQLIAAITPKIQVSQLTNHLYQLNKQELLEHIESNSINFTKKIQFDDVNQQKQFELDRQFINKLIVDKPLEPFEYFEKYILKSYQLNPSDVEQFLRPAIMTLSSEKEYFKHDRFEKYLDVMDVAIDELTYDLDKDKKNTLIQSLTYFGHQVSQNLFSLYYEAKVNDCLDINADNFSHVLLPKPKTDDEHKIIQHLSDKLVELGVKPVLYVRNDTIQLEQDNVKEHLKNMEINHVVTNLINNHEVKIINDFQYQSLDLDGVGYLDNNQVTNKKRYKMK